MATRIPISDLDPDAKKRIQQGFDEHLRMVGAIRALVLRQLARKDDPTTDDLAVAFMEGPDVPEAIRAYITTRYLTASKPRKTGRQAPPRTLWAQVQIIARYQHQLGKARQRQQAGLVRDPATRAKRITATHFGISVRTLETLIAPRPLRKT